MTEARVNVYKGQFIEESVVLSEEPGRREVTLTSCNPPVFVEHGENREGAVVVFRDKKIHRLEPGNNRTYRFGEEDDKKLMEIIHKSSIYKF